MHTQWTKSSHSAGNGACLQTRWHTSSYSGGNGCVEARHDSTVQVRDSKLGDASPILNFNVSTWTSFIDAIRDGRFVKP